MRTTIDLPDPLFRAVKTRAVQQGTTLKQLVASYLEAGLRDEPRVRPAAAGGRAPLPTAIARDPAAPLAGALTNRALEALLAREERAHHRRVVRRAPGAA